MFWGRKGEMGIGTLVLFIAMILVAAIAAGVLIQTATNLQSKALETGQRSTRQVSTAVRTILLYGEDGINGNISALRQNVNLVAGSESIKFADSVVSVDTSNISNDLTYEAATPCEGATGDYFRVKYLKNGTNHKDGYLEIGDVAQLCYDAPREVFEDELIRINFVPKVGSVMTVKVTTPPVINTLRVFLYP
jgi:flagellin FlaB